jgi:hypothetical protein
MNSSDEQIDEIIRSRIQGLNSQKFIIGPSANFTSRVMARVSLIERRRRWLGYFGLVVGSMAPLMLREFWFAVRGDYFSVSSWPMGRLIVGTYHFFISPAALYTLLALGVSASVLHTFRFKKHYTSSIRIA